jgi:penicillin-binding protein 2
LAEWAARFGLGSGAADWPEAARGHVPAADELDASAALQAAAIGQGTLTATPLEIVRLFAAIANGGTLVEPRLVRDAPAAGSFDDADATPAAVHRIDGLSSETLALVRSGLERVVADPAGTAYQSARIEGLPIAGKTGTAETGDAAGDHAWFAGYAPADAPRYAFVVALEHGGSGGEAAATLARHVVERMRQLGCFGPVETAENRRPGTGKG